MSKIHVFCSRPGLIRGGFSNPRHAEYDFGHHTQDQLRDLVNEPETTVVIGDEVTEAWIAENEAKAKKAAK